MAMNKQRKTGNILNIVSYDTSGNVTLPAAIAAGTIHNTGYTQFLKPAGGSYVTQASSVTGAIAVSLPVGMTDSMLRVTIKIYEYTTNESFEVHAGGYAYGAGTWANNPFAYIIGNPGVDRRFNVRFGLNSTTGKAVIYIGELASTWSYPQVHITEIQIGYSGMTAAWLNACSIGFETSAFQNETALISNSQVGYAVSTNTANSTVYRDASGNFAAGAITAASLSATNVIASNFSDSTGSYNVNLGSGGSEGRGLVAGYSGGSYGGIGYNVRHTTTGGFWIAPGTDTSSYLVFSNGGFVFYGAPAGAAGRGLSYTTLGSFSADGTFNAINATVSGSQVLHASNYTSYSPSLTGSGASGNWGININGTAAAANYLNGNNYIVQRTGNNNWNTDFQLTPAGAYSYYGDGYLSGAETNNPGGTWWIQQNFRHYNTSSFWGVQVAWGWEDNANKLATRNVQSGTFGNWVYYLNSSNFSSYALPLTGGTLTGALTISTGTDGALTLRVPSSEPSEWNYINFTGSNGVRDAYFGTDSVGNPIWNREDNSLNITLGSVATVNGVQIVTNTGTWGISISGSAVTSTTRANSDNSVNIATTAYVKSLFGSQTTSGVLDWNDVSNIRPGTSPTLLLGSATNGFGRGIYYHPLNLEYSTKDGSGNVTQLAIAYSSPADDIKMRGRYDGVWSSWITFLNSGNYNSYSPTLTGDGASGTWGISITGNAATVGGVSASKIVHGDTGSRRGVNLISDWNQVTFPDAAFLSSEGSSSNSPTADFLYGVQMSFHRSGPDYRSQFVTSLYGNNVYYLRTRRDTQGWTSWVTLIHSSNYNSYAPTLTGTGASGTWGINVTGNAATVTVGAGNNTASWFPIAWHSGNFIYSASGVEIYPAGNYIRAQYINTTDNDEGGITRFVIKNGDSYHRSATTTTAADIIRGVASGTWNINISGNSNNITQYTINQNLGTANGPTFTEIYNNGWFRNNAGFTGLYNSTTTQHWSSKDNGYWDASSTNTVSAIRFFTGGHLANLRGYVFANSSNEIGFQDLNGAWLIRCANVSNTYLTGTLTASADLIAYSDARVKENIQTVEDALSIVTKLRGVTYNRTDVEDKSRKVGVIAQEIMEVLPEVVNQGDNGMYGVSYGNIVGVLIEAIKEQQLKIDDLQKQIDYLGENR